MPDYPLDMVCANCGQRIFVHWSKKKGKEYAGNTFKSYEDFHQCPNWKGDKSKLSEPSKPAPKQQPTPQPTTKVPTKQDTFETAESALRFERTFKIVEVTISKSRKCNEKTIPQLLGFQSIDYFISLKAEVEINTDVQHLIEKKFAEITQAIDQEIIADRLRLSNLKGDE